MACLETQIRNRKNYALVKNQAQVMADIEQKNVGIFEDMLVRSKVWSYEVSKEGKKYFEIIKFRKHKNKTILRNSEKSTVRKVKSQENKNKPGGGGKKVVSNISTIPDDNGQEEI